MKRLILTGLLFAVVAVAQAAPNVKRVVLPNGLTVLAIEDRVSTVAGFHLGVRYDPAANSVPHAGVAALSQQVTQAQLSETLNQDAWRDLAQQLRGTRAALIANTEVDYCELRGKVTDDMLPPALQLVGRLMLGRPAIAPEQLQAAREILLASEKDDTNAVMEQTFYSFLKAFHGAGSPLAQPVQGTPDSLRALTANDVTAFRAAYMTPNNAVLTLVAPRSVSDLVSLAKLAFGTYAAGGTAVKPPTTPGPASSRVHVAQQTGWRGVSLLIGVPTPSYGTAGFYRAQLIYTLLEGRGGRLDTDSALRGGLGANRIVGRPEAEPPPAAVLPPTAQPRPFLLLHMVVAPRQMEQARRALLWHFQALQTDPPTAAELDRAKGRLLG